MSEPVFFTSDEGFQDWLVEHGKSKQEIWVGYHRKSTGRPSLTWSASVDAALCFGWIDGVRKRIDEQSYKIRFTPRKPNSIWSAVNVAKVQDLIKRGKMRPEGLELFNARRDTKGYKSADRAVHLSAEFEEKIKAYPEAWAYLNSLAPSYKRDSIWWVMSAKRQDTRLRRLDVLISSSLAGLRIPSLRK